MARSLRKICERARRVAKVPGYATQSGEDMNSVLWDLVHKWDLKVNRLTTTITVNANTYGPFNLPAGYLRTYDLFYLVNNVPFRLSQIETKKFDTEVKDPSVTNYPYEYFTDTSTQAQLAASGGPGQLFIYPQSSGVIIMTHRYMTTQPDYPNPETNDTIPWFTDENYLELAVAARLMRVTDDVRRKEFEADAKESLREHLVMAADDEQQVVHRVTLDPISFRAPSRLKPTKLTD